MRHSIEFAEYTPSNATHLRLPLPIGEETDINLSRLTPNQLEVRNSYIGSPRKIDAQRRMKYLATMGATNIECNPQGTEIIGFRLPEANYRGFEKLLKHLLLLACFDKESWFNPPKQPTGMVEPVASYTPSQVLETLMLNIPVFSELFRNDIKVSKAHMGTNPGQHTWKVFERMPVDHFNTVIGRLVSMVTALFHDTGKAANIEKGGLACGDEYHDHAHISGYVLRELLRHYLVDNTQMNEQESQQVAGMVSLIVEMHHALELVERKILSLKELLFIIERKHSELQLPASDVRASDIERKLLTGQVVPANDILTYLSPAKIVEHLGVLTIADRQSANLNSVFVLTTLQLLRDLVNQNEAPPHLLVQIEEIIARGFDSVWQLWRQVMPQDTSGDMVKMFGRIAPDFADVTEAGHVIGEAGWLSAILRWLAGEEDPQPLKQHLGVK